MSQASMHSPIMKYADNTLFRIQHRQLQTESHFAAVQTMHGPKIDHCTTGIPGQQRAKVVLTRGLLPS